MATITCSGIFSQGFGIYKSIKGTGKSIWQLEGREFRRIAKLMSKYFSKKFHCFVGLEAGDRGVKTLGNTLDKMVKNRKQSTFSHT